MAFSYFISFIYKLNSTYINLFLGLLQIDNRILKAASIEHASNLEAAVDFILQEVIPSIPEPIKSSENGRGKSIRYGAPPEGNFHLSIKIFFLDGYNSNSIIVITIICIVLGHNLYAEIYLQWSEEEFCILS